MKEKHNYLNFTKRGLESLPKAPQGKRSYYRDTKLRGLELMVTDKGIKCFKVYRKINGRPIRVTLGRFPELSVENARTKGIEINSELNEGKNPNIEKKKIREEVTLGGLFTKYMKDYSKKYKKSWKYDEREIPKFLGHWFNRKISDISNPEIRALKTRVHDENGLYQANRILERLRAMYKKAIEWGWVGNDPTVGIKKYREKSRERFIQPDEMYKLFTSLDEESNITACDYFKVTLLTGARKTNVLQMKWVDIDLFNRKWTIPETKNGDPLTVPLSSHVMEILKRRKANCSGSEWVFPGDGRDGHYQDPKRAWNRILERAGINDLRIHDLRRTFGSYQAINNSSAIIIAKSLGHRSIQSTAIYSKLNLDPVRDAIEKATDNIISLATKQVIS